MKYLAILGRQPEFGLAELECRLGPSAITHSDDQFVTLNLQQELDINQFGGILKLARIIYEGPMDTIDSLPFDTWDLPTGSGKTVFAVSLYGVRISTKYHAIQTGKLIKRELKSKGSIRFVAPDSNTTSVAQLKFNKVLEKGFELIIYSHRAKTIVALTESYQDIDWYAKRDYERPARSAKVGMLPPKLAQIMINTTSAHSVYDPFCGTGVVLQEALLLGRRACGSDISPQMVSATQQNIEWLQSQVHRTFLQCEIQQADATKLDVPREPLAIVSEGFLGPNQISKPDQKTYLTLRNDLGRLYMRSLQNWANQIPGGTDVTITTPCWHTQDGWQGLDILDRLPDLGYTLRVLKHVDTQKLIYRRPDQIVGRQLLLLRKI